MSFCFCFDRHEELKFSSPLSSSLSLFFFSLTQKKKLDDGKNNNNETESPSSPPRLCGGSSSGSACAVAARAVDFALGSDTGGSVRVPASYCGVFGFRPSHGRVPMGGAQALAPSFDTAGWFAKDAETLRDVGKVLLSLGGEGGGGGAGGAGAGGAGGAGGGGAGAGGEEKKKK